MNDWRVTHVNGRCLTCGGTGMKVLHSQGAPVEVVEQSPVCITTYASTVYVTCECRVTTSSPVGSDSPFARERT